MGENSKIQWCHHTFNPWIGCQKVSAECDHCYAKDNTFVRIQRKAGRELWGNQLRSERHVTGEAYWREPLAWNRTAEEAGDRHRVFCASLADVFEDRKDLLGPRSLLFELIERTPALDWLLLTKRPENVMAMVPESWRGGFPSQVWLGTSTGTQQSANQRIPDLLRCPAAVRFLSCEPLLGPVDLTEVELPSEYRLSISTPAHINALTTQDDEHYHNDHAAVHWIIAGGESGPGARPCETSWIRSLIQQGHAAGVPVFVKQLGANVPYPGDGVLGCGSGIVMDPTEPNSRERVALLRDRKGGDPSEWPEDLRVREFPQTAEVAHG